MWALAACFVLLVAGMTWLVYWVYSAELTALPNELPWHSKLRVAIGLLGATALMMAAFLVLSQ